MCARVVGKTEDTIESLADVLYRLAMVKGFNSDVSVRGKSYHVQTEDWGTLNPFFVSRVFCNGAVVKTIKTPYSEALRGGPVNDFQAITQALRRQHHRILDDLVSFQD